VPWSIGAIHNFSYGSATGEKPNAAIGIAKGIFPGRVIWAHDPKVTSWDGAIGYWWEDRYAIRWF